ncbi:asparagine synthase-related protein [Verrucomicrobiota bacterium]
MRVTINRVGGGTDAIPAERFRESERLLMWGRVERLHGGQGAWFPSIASVSAFLEQADESGDWTSVRHIEGRFLAIWSCGASVRIFCDRYCLRPVFYRLTATTLEIMDEVLALGRDLHVTTEAASAFSLLRFIPGRQTLFQDISRIMPGDQLVLDTSSGNLRVDSFPVYPKLSPAGHYYGTVGEEWHGRFKAGLEKRIGRYGSTERLIVPISGGLDSRYILATALELVESRRLLGATFGAPGSLDFEIGKQVAEEVGIEHVAFPLSVADYAIASFRENCFATDGQINFITEAPVAVFDRLAEYGKVVLSGYVGDTVMGKKAEKQHECVRRDVVFTDTVLPQSDPLEDTLTDRIVEDSFYFEQHGESSLSSAELWFFVNHFTKYSQYSVFRKSVHFDYIVPFVDYGFLDYVLNLPFEARTGRSAYIGWFVERFPALARLPSKTFCGASLDAGTARRFLARQRSRVERHILHADREMNTIDYLKHCRKLVRPEDMVSCLRGRLPDRYVERLAADRLRGPILYNLKCLTILHENFGVSIGTEGSPGS